MHAARGILQVSAGACALALGIAALTVSTPAAAAPGEAIGPFNPVRTPLGQLVDGHPANSGFLVFVEGDTTVNADESEGTMATGGDYIIGKGYNVAAGVGPFYDTFTAPGDAQPTYLWAGGQVVFPTTAENVEVHNGGFAKIGDATSYTALTTDMNGTPGLATHIVPPGQAYEYSPRIQLATSQAPDSVYAVEGTSELIDVPAAFALYRETATLMGTCSPTIELLNRDDSQPLPSSVPPGANGRITLTPGETNVLNITTTDLENLASLTFTTQPNDTTPLLINVFGSSFNGTNPTSAGIGSANAHFILLNFVDATSVMVTGGDSLMGTIYAPYAGVNWQVTQNIEGNVVASSFVHGANV
ncbi:collagen-binding domain-containing protein, partial [Microbacterium halotolerans]|uniref:collagen-binding domain-containing protein n=1 Tax=Microbacterium halotolerans TaxID=246613 RepID=UPI000E6ABF64